MKTHLNVKTQNSLGTCNEIEFVLLKWQFYHLPFNVSIKFNELLCVATESQGKLALEAECKCNLSYIFYLVRKKAILAC